MAKKEETTKTVLERVYNIPIRRETLKVPYYRKAKKAVKAVKEFIEKHMKSSDMNLGRHLNNLLWRHGMKNPPHHVKVNAVKDDKGKVFVELVGAPKEAPKVEEKKSAKKAEAAKEKPAEKLEKEVAEVKEEKAEEAKKIEQEEIKELKKEHPKQHMPKEPSKTKFQQEHQMAPKHV